MQKHLGIEAIHTPIYWPQGNGLIERQHQVLKNSLKAQLIEMANEYQDRWFHFLPWALLGCRTSFNKDLQTSSAELTFGRHPQIPMALAQPVKFDHTPDIQSILSKIRLLNERTATPTSTNVQEKVDPPGEKVTHVYTKQHNKKGLDSSFKGPFEIISRPSRSTIEIKVGVNKDNRIKVMGGCETSLFA